MTPVIDLDLCISCGLCEDICPEVFQVRDDGVVYVIDAEPEPELYGSIRDTVASCPVGAISFGE